MFFVRVILLIMFGLASQLILVLTPEAYTAFWSGIVFENDVDHILEVSLFLKKRNGDVTQHNINFFPRFISIHRSQTVLFLYFVSTPRSFLGSVIIRLIKNLNAFKQLYTFANLRFNYLRVSSILLSLFAVI